MENLNSSVNLVHTRFFNRVWQFTFILFATLFIGAEALAQSSSPIGKSGKAGDFEIDADFITGSCTNSMICQSTGLDWRSVLRQVDLSDPSKLVRPGESNVADENAVWVVDGNSGSGVSTSNPDNRERETFAGTSNKNGDFISPGQNPYSIDTSNPSAPQKNDLTNIYVRSKMVSGKMWVFLGAETRSVDGTSYLDFEYNQAGITKSSSQMFGPSSLASSGGRTPKSGAMSGDLLFVVDFSKGGNTPIPKVFEWQQVTKANKTTYAWVEISIPDGKAFIVTNGANILPAGLNTGYNGDGSASNTTIALQFVEMGINLTDLGLGGANPCSPEATMLVKTRTSSSYTSELKDFSLFDFTLVPAAQMQDIDDVAICPGNTATFESVVSGDGASGTNIKWYKVTTEDNPNTPANEEVLALLADGGDGGDISISVMGLKSTLKIANVSSGDAGRYKAVLTGATCGQPFEYARLTINTISNPIVTLIEPSICDAIPTGTLTICNPVVGANYYLEQLDANGDPLSQYHQEKLNYQSGELKFTGLVAGYKFKLKVEKDGCEAYADCASKAGSCPSTLTSSTTPVEGVSTSTSLQGVRNSNTEVGLGDQKLTAYPIPFSNKATVEFRMLKSDRYEVNLYDIKGNLIKVLKSGKAKADELQQIEVDGRDLPDGIYLVRMASGKGVQTVKLLKKE